MNSLQAAVGYLVRAEVAGQRGLAEMVAPVNAAIDEVTGLVADLGLLPVVDDEVGAMLARGMRALTRAQSSVGAVVSAADSAARIVSGIEGRLGVLAGQVTRAAALVNRLVGGGVVDGAVIQAADLVTNGDLPSELASAYPHLMVLQPLTPRASAYYFGLSTAAYDDLQRQTSWQWASQERLGRRPAKQAVGKGDDKLTLKGAVFPHWRGGIGQLNQLRAIGDRMEPFLLTTGYGEVLGTWCLAGVRESQSALIAGGIPRKQEFTLELERYGDDMQDV